MKDHTVQASWAMMLAMVFYGVSFPATVVALEVFSPITIVTFRLIISTIFLLVWNLLRNGREGLPKRSELKIFVIIALFQPLGYFLCETYGLKYVSASAASILIATIPVFTPMISRFFVYERLTRYNYFGLLLSFLGVIILVAADASDSGSGSILGIALILGAVLSAVFYTILIKRLPLSYSPLAITSIQNTIGLFMFLPLFFLIEYDSSYLRSVFSGTYGYSALISILFLAIFASSLAFVLMNYGIQVIGPSKANGFVNLIPAITAVTSIAFFGEHMSLRKGLGMAVVFSGVLIAQRRTHVRRDSSIPC